MAQLKSTDHSESTTSLTSKSELYRIYSEGNINDDMDNTDIYTNLNQDIHKHPITDSGVTTNHSGVSHHLTPLNLFNFCWKIVALGIAGNAYFSLLESIDIGKKIQLPSLEDFKMLFVFTKIPFLQEHLKADYVVMTNNAIFGILLGTVDTFLFDFIFKSFFNIPKRSSYESTTIIRSLAAIMGITYGLKNLEWESSLQASLAWSLLNPCLWILLDGTIYGFVIDSSISLAFATASYYYDPQFFLVPDVQLEFWNKLLWIGSASFVGLLVFGKIGRFFFK